MSISDNSNAKPLLLLSITVFSVRMCFSSARKTRLARGARNGRSSTPREVHPGGSQFSDPSCADGGPSARIADRARCEKPHRTQSTILY